MIYCRPLCYLCGCAKSCDVYYFCQVGEDKLVSKYVHNNQGLAEVAVFRGLPRFDLAEVKTPADPAGVGVKIFSGVKSSPGSG